MEMKHIIIFAVIGIVALLGFNIINGNSHEKNREMIVSSTVSEQPTAAAVSDTDNTTNSSENIVNKPLGEQPKAILDDATSKIDQAQQSEQDRLDQMSSAQ